MLCLPLQSGRPKLLTQNHAQHGRKQLFARYDKCNIALNQLLAFTRAQARQRHNQRGLKYISDALRASLDLLNRHRYGVLEAGQRDWMPMNAADHDVVGVLHKIGQLRCSQTRLQAHCPLTQNLVKVLNSLQRQRSI